MKKKATTAVAASSQDASDFDDDADGDGELDPSILAKYKTPLRRSSESSVSILPQIYVPIPGVCTPESCASSGFGMRIVHVQVVVY